MSGQKFYANPRNTFEWPNGAIGYRPGGPLDCLGPFAKVINCPIRGTDAKRTAYATGYADTCFSVPARCQYKGKTLRGYFSTDDSGVYFQPYDRQDTQS